MRKLSKKSSKLTGFGFCLFLVTILITVRCKNMPEKSSESLAKTTLPQFTVCGNQTYALCTSAPCIPNPVNPQSTLCFCEVIENGVSLNSLPPLGRNDSTVCESLAPFEYEGMTFLYSTYSTKQMGEDKRQFLQCDSTYAWSDCLNQLCVVNPNYPKVAVCFCIKSSGTSYTLGGNCNTTTCGKKLWSAADTASADLATLFLNNWLLQNGQDSLIQKSVYCD